MSEIKQSGLKQSLLGTRAVLQQYALAFKGLLLLPWTERAIERQLAKASERTENDYAQISPTGGSLPIESVNSNIVHYASRHDIDMLACYEKFSVLKNPALPLAVINMRIATGKHEVSDILTQLHLDAHARVASVAMNVLDEDSASERNFNKLQVFLFSNFDRAHDIVRIIEQHQIVDPKGIILILNEESKYPSALVDGVL